LKCPWKHRNVSKSSETRSDLVFFFFLLWAVLELNLGFALARQAFYHLRHTPALFTVVILEIGSCFLPRLAKTVILLFYTSSHSWDDRHVPPHPAFFLLRWGSQELSCLDWAGMVIFLIPCSLGRHLQPLAPTSILI
jgi:hypothetical protein